MRTVTLLLLAATTTLYSQALPRLPVSYSYQATTQFFRPDPAILQVSRDRDRELIEFTIAPKGFNAQPSHKRILFDFAAHVAQLQDEAGCRSYRNALDAAPALLDPVNGSGVAELVSSHPQFLRSEMVNGLAARMVKAEGATIWLARDYDFPIRQVTPGAERDPWYVELDVRQLVLKAPLAARFAAPAACGEADPALPPLGQNHDDGWDDALRLQAQPLRLPLVYSLRLRDGDEVKQVDRNGQLEAVVIRKGKQSRRVAFDFLRHRVAVVDGEGCRETEYLPGVPPVYLDPISTEVVKSLLDQRIRVLRWEMLRGVRTRLVENRNTPGPVIDYYWLPEKYDFPLKYAFRLTEEPKRGLVTAWEIEQIQYAPPAAAAVEFPKGCVAVPGTVGGQFEGWDQFFEGKQ